MFNGTQKLGVLVALSEQLSFCFNHALFSVLRTSTTLMFYLYLCSINILGVCICFKNRETRTENILLRNLRVFQGTRTSSGLKASMPCEFLFLCILMICLLFCTYKMRTNSIRVSAEVNPGCWGRGGRKGCFQKHTLTRRIACFRRLANRTN